MAAGPLAALRSKMRNRIFNLVVAGEFKRGKSSVINALLGEQVLPTGVLPLTSVVTSLKHAESPNATVVFDNGESREVPFGAIADHVTEPKRSCSQGAEGRHDFASCWPWNARWKSSQRLADFGGRNSLHLR